MSLADLNINSIRNKFDELADMTTENVDISISQSTQKDSFADSQFHLVNASLFGLVEINAVVG